MSRPSAGLLGSTAKVGAITTVSRVLGFVRDIVIARAFGATIGADAFFVAFRIPNFLRRLFAEGAFSQAFVPVLSEYKANRTHQEVRDLAAHVVGLLGGILFLVTLVGVLAAPLIVMAFAPGFVDSGGKFDLTVHMLRIMFPYIVFISLTSFAAGILNTYGQFGVPAFTPVLLNLALIASAVWLAPLMDEPVTALAWGVLLAGVVQLAFQLPFLSRLDLLTRPRLAFGHQGVRRIVRLIGPAVFGVSVVQINLLIDTIIASFIATGSISWLYFSDRLVEFPLGVFGIALATVILPSLSGQHAARDAGAFSGTLDWALRGVVVVATPCAIGLAVLALPILTTLFQYGAFSRWDVEMASLSLVAYSTGLVGFVAIKVLAPGYFSRQDMRTPVRVGVIAMLTNVTLNLALVGSLAHAGLALATAVAAFVNAGLLYRGLVREGIYRPGRGWRRLWCQVGLGNVAMIAFLWSFGGDPSTWFAAPVLDRALHLAALVVGGAGVYAVTLRLLGMRPRDLLAPSLL